MGAEEEGWVLIHGSENEEQKKRMIFTLTLPIASLAVSKSLLRVLRIGH